MAIEVLNPTYDESPSAFEGAARLQTLAGATVGIISNGKHGTAPFFDALAEELRTAHGVAEVVRVIKPNYSAPAPDEILSAAQRWHALVAGIGD
ncbi:MAG: hypothetical protein AAF962_09745 [Actinomycetota bacterium]